MTCMEVRACTSLCCCTASFPSTRKTGVDAHLDACADCRAELEREKALHAAFDGVAVDRRRPCCGSAGPISRRD